MAMPSASGISTKGLKYKLDNDSLQFGVREGTLNLSSAEKISIGKKKGDLLVFLSLL
jgi:thiamine pyrophosphokinase